MIARTAFVMLLIAVPAALAQSPQTCLWLNRGTASKILGSDVTVTAHSESNWNGTCQFAALGDSSRAIEIVVGRPDDLRCDSGFKSLPAIGNQARLCSYLDANRQHVQIISGRVRDTWFAITLRMPRIAPESRTAPGDPPPSSPIEFLAEQVSGNLY